MWYDLVLFLLSTVGLAVGFTRSTLIKPIREKVSRLNQLANSIDKKDYFVWYINELLNCVYCASIWTGVFMYLSIYYFNMSWIAYPFAGSLTARIVYKHIKE
jgi:hypothetical protein